MPSAFITRLLSVITSTVTSVFNRWRTPAFVPVAATTASTPEQAEVIDQVKQELPELVEPTLDLEQQSSVDVLMNLLEQLSAPAQMKDLALQMTVPTPRTSVDGRVEPQGEVETLLMADLAGSGTAVLTKTAATVELLPIQQVQAEEFIPVFINPNKAVIAGHGMVEKRAADGTYRCRCDYVLAGEGVGRDAARVIMKSHRESLRG